MKVRELQAQLAKLDPDLDVVCYTEDTDLPGDGRVIVFEVLAANKTEAEWVALDDGTRSLKFGKGDASQAIALLEVTSDL